MRTRISGVLVALAIALLVPTAALAADTPVAVYHGTWDTAGWEGNPETCPMALLGEIPASGNWNVTILPGATMAVVHITMFTTFPNPDTGGDRIKVGSWGGGSFGQFWTVDSAGLNGFTLHMDLTKTPYGSWNTFVFDGTKLTFTIAPWAVGPLFCDAAIAHGTAGR